MIIRLLVVVLTVGLVQTCAQSRVIDEYQLKAAFLFNFAKFVEWPATAFNGADAPFGICVLGENPFRSALEETVRGSEVAGKRFAIRKISDARQAAGCHILFMGASERRRSRAVLEELKGFSILTVGETDDFISNGGVIRFKLKEAQLRFEIDADAAAREKLKISSKLMSLGDARKK
jgi:YfiR/HmsC-like